MNKLRFTKTHEWLLVTGDEVTIGITDHAQDLLGDVVYIELPEPGTRFNAGDEMAVVESVKAAADVYTPITGEVVAINEEALNNPGLVNSKPYETGWLVRLKPKNPDEINALMDEAEYQSTISESH